MPHAPEEVITHNVDTPEERARVAELSQSLNDRLNAIRRLAEKMDRAGAKVLLTATHGVTADLRTAARIALGQTGCGLGLIATLAEGGGDFTMPPATLGDYDEE